MSFRSTQCVRTFSLRFRLRRYLLTKKFVIKKDMQLSSYTIIGYRYKKRHGVGGSDVLVLFMTICFVLLLYKEQVQRLTPLA